MLTKIDGSRHFWRLARCFTRRGGVQQIHSISQEAVGEMAAHIEGLRATHEWPVLARDDRIIGFSRVAWMQLDLRDAGGPDGPLARLSDPQVALGLVGR
jgi:hypothetical protein